MRLGDYKVVAIKVVSGRPERVRRYVRTFDEAKRVKAQLVADGYAAAMFTKASAHTQVFIQVVR